MNRDSQAVIWDDGACSLDLNTILGVNSKAIFNGEQLSEAQLALHPGRLSQSLLAGLSLAAGVLAWDGKTPLQQFITIVDSVAEKAKDVGNKDRASGRQKSTINYGSSFIWQALNRVIVFFEKQVA